MTNVNQGPSISQTTNFVPVQSDSVTGIQVANDVPLSSIDSIGLTRATQTQSQVIENVSLASGAAALTFANFTGPGIVNRLGIILACTAGGAQVFGALQINIFVDGETVASLQFDGDLWGVSKLTASTPSGGTNTMQNIPQVFENDYLQMFYLQIATADDLQLVFKYPIPFNTSLIGTITNPSSTGTNISNLWLATEVQSGIVSPRRLKSSLVNFASPVSIPSAVLYNAGTTYATGNLATFQSVLYQSLTNSNTGNTPSTSPSNWSAVNAQANQNFNTGYQLLALNSPCWIVHMSMGVQGPVNGGTYGSVNTNANSLLESNIAIYDGSNPAPSFEGNSPVPTYNSTGTEDFFGGSFYWATLGNLADTTTYSNSSLSIPLRGVIWTGALTFTAGPTGATSATLAAAWPLTTGVYTVAFSDNSQRQVTLTNGATTATWAGAVTATANANVVYPLRPWGKTSQNRYSFVVSSGGGGAFLAANVSLLALNGGIRCGTSCIMRWEEGNSVRANSGPITANNTWKVNYNVLYYV